MFMDSKKTFRRNVGLHIYNIFMLKLYHYKIEIFSSSKLYKCFLESLYICIPIRFTENKIISFHYVTHPFFNMQLEKFVFWFMNSNVLELILLFPTVSGYYKSYKFMDLQLHAITERCAIWFMQRRRKA